MEAESEYPKLYAFLSGYFNQDWLGDYEGGEPELIEDFRLNNPPATVRAVAQELRRLLEVMPPESITDDFLFLRLGCYTSSGEPGVAANATWLKSILDRIDP